MSDLRRDDVQQTCALYEGVRFDALAPKPHVESYFVKANDPFRRRALWVRATIFASRRDPSAAIAEAWAIAFREDGTSVAVKTQVPFARARFSREGIDISIADVLTMTRLASAGGIETGDRKVTWDFSIGGREEALVHLPTRRMYEKKFPAQKYVSPRLDARITGKFQVHTDASDETWDIENWPALLGHNWGAGNTPLYAWAHCNAWTGSEEVVFEAVAGKPKLGPAPSPKLLSSFYVRHRGVRYDMNRVGTILGARSRLDVTGDPKTWRFSAKTDLARIEGEISCATSGFVGLYYANPTGPVTYCLNSKLATIRLSLALSGRHAFEVRSDKCAFEIGTRDPHHGVRMYV